MTIKLSRRGGVPPFIVMDMFREANRRAAAGARVLHLHAGQPASGAPRGVIEAAMRALASVPLGYTEALGIPALRQRIAAHYRDWYGAAVAPERVTVTIGASGAFILAFLAAFDAGDRVALAIPAYPAYRNILAALDIEVVPIVTTAAERFQPTPAALDRIAELDGLILASPSNPTGSMVTDGELAELGRYCRGRGIRLISDEIYHGITFGAPATTALAHDGEAVVVNSFSKYFGMTGWRLGWLVLPETMVRPVECLAQNLAISAPTLAQHAALAAFDCHEELQANVRRYAANRAVLLDALPRAGFRDFLAPDGAFYVYAGIAGITSEDSLAFCHRLLAETGIAAAPGLDFDAEGGGAYVRFSFAGASADVEEAAGQLVAWRSAS